MTRRLPDDCFALPPGIDWTPVDAALDMLRERLAAVTPIETVPVDRAAGRIVAAPVAAVRDNPPLRNAAVDGYAFAWTGAGARTLPLVEGRAAAGVPYPGVVPPGTAVRVLTGASVPEGTDTVVLDEDCTAPDGGSIRFPAPKSAGANTRPAGEDVSAGETLFQPGHRLRPQDLAWLSATGVAAVRVRRRLRVAILSTGDELLPTGVPAAAHQIYDANRPMLRALVSAWGYDLLDLGISGDRAGEVRAALDRGAQHCHAILTTGGASAGDEDHVSRLIRTEGRLTTWRIAVKPGRPLALGQWRDVPVFGLPGNPVAAFVTALIFARPSLGCLAGAGWSLPRSQSLPAAFTKTKKAGRREYLRARLTEDGAVEVFRSEGSGLIGGLAWSDGLVVLPEDAMTVSPGVPVEFLSYAALGAG